MNPAKQGKGQGRRRRRRAQHQRGAVMVEAVIVGASLVLMFAALAFIHRYASATLLSVERARGRVWQSAMSGCDQPSNNVQGLVGQAKGGGDDGFISMWGNFIPEVLTTSESFSVADMLNDGTVGDRKSVV